MRITDFDGSCEVQRVEELFARLRTVRRGEFGIFILDQGGSELLWLLVKGEIAYLCYQDSSTGGAGFVPNGMWNGEQKNVSFRLLSESEGDVIEVYWMQLVPT